MKPPVKATQTGFATLSRAIQDESISATHRSELIALPILLLVLLIVFRSPVAAIIPLTFGAITVITSRGVLALLSSVISIDGFALTVSTMMGLALGVDYALLMVSRYREEIGRGLGAFEAAAVTRKTAGRTTVFAGSTLFLAMVVSVPILPGALLVSLAGTLMVVVILSVSVATIVAPALLALLGPNLNRWRIGKGEPTDRPAVMPFVGAALRRPVFATLLIGGIVLVLAGPAFGLKTGPPSTEQLPEDNNVREDFDVVQKAIGPGYEAPFVLVSSTEDGTMTEHERLSKLAKWQRRIAQDPAVQAVIGPEAVAKQTAPLKSAGQELHTTNKKGGQLYELNRLGPGLERAENGVSKIRNGFAEAAGGAGLLSEGSGNAEDGALQIANGLGEALEGSEEAVTRDRRTEQGLGKNRKGSGSSPKARKKRRAAPKTWSGSESARTRTEADDPRWTKLDKELEEQSTPTTPNWRKPPTKADETLNLTNNVKANRRKAIGGSDQELRNGEIELLEGEQGTERRLGRTPRRNRRTAQRIESPARRPREVQDGDLRTGRWDQPNSRAARKSCRPTSTAASTAPTRCRRSCAKRASRSPAAPTRRPRRSTK